MARSVKCESKNPQWGFLTLFPKRLGIFNQFYTPTYMYVHIYSRLQIFIQLSSTVTKLCHIKCDHPVCISAGSGHFEHNWCELGGCA